jgi:hypothetical protein
MVAQKAGEMAASLVACWAVLRDVTWVALRAVRKADERVV